MIFSGIIFPGKNPDRLLRRKHRFGCGIYHLAANEVTKEASGSAVKGSGDVSDTFALQGTGGEAVTSFALYDVP